MKLISTTIQKKMAYIPIINILTLWCTLGNIIYLQTPFSIWMKVYKYLLIYMIPSAIFWMLLASLFPSLETVCSLATSYITPLLMSIGLIRFQEKHLNI